MGLDCMAWKDESRMGQGKWKFEYTVRVMQIGLRARIGKCVGFRKDKRDLASTCKKLRPFNCPVSP